MEMAQTFPTVTHVSRVEWKANGAAIVFTFLAAKHTQRIVERVTVKDINVMSHFKHNTGSQIFAF